MQRSIAKELGWKEVAEQSHYQPVLKVGKKYVSWDTEGHNGGIWKMAASPKGLQSRETRMGTYDMYLKNRVGD